MSQYKSRAHQTRAHQMRAIAAEVKAGSYSLNRALRDAAMCGAEEERSRTLNLLRANGQCHPYTALATEITSVSILDMLGYPKTRTAKARR